MDKNLIDYIQSLTDSDPKTLSQRIAKAVEELGELSKVILPYEQAPQTRHRFTTKEKVLEEVADCSLALLSILMDKKIGLTVESLYPMMQKKADKWGNLQAREMNLAENLPYEIHITVDAKSPEFDVQEYKEVCRVIGVKPIILDLELNKGMTLKDVMTSSKVFGTVNDVTNELTRISDELIKCGYEVIRKKVETVPWHPMAPSIECKNDYMPKDCYFESHFGILVESEQNRKILDDLVKLKVGKSCLVDLHISRNAFKKGENGSYVVMATYRDKESYKEHFLDRVEKISQIILDHGFNLERPITEFSIYDTKVSHDSEWIKK